MDRNEELLNLLRQSHTWMKQLHQLYASNQAADYAEQLGKAIARLEGPQSADKPVAAPKPAPIAAPKAAPQPAPKPFTYSPEPFVEPKTIFPPVKKV